jgi:hypothetical protein
VIHFRRTRTRLVVSLAVVAVCGVAITGPGAVGQAAAATAGKASATAAGPGPTGVPAGPGCPSAMRAWVPVATALASGNPQEVAPGSLSPQARAEFGAQVLRILAGHHVRWLGSTGCGGVNARTATATRGASSQAAASSAQCPSGTSGSISSKPTQNWSGFESDAQSFTGASMTWTVPTPGPSTAPALMSIWPGIGSGSSSGDQLIQAGTEQGVGSSPLAWIEVVPQLPLQCTVNGMTVSTGDNFAVNVGWDASTSTAAFLLADYSSGVVKEITTPVSGSSGSSAEWIVERTESCANSACTPGIFPHLLDFKDLDIANGAAEQTNSQGITTEKYIGQFGSLVSHPMNDCAGKETLATITWNSTTLSSQGDFLDTFDHPGPVDPGHCQWTISPASGNFTAGLSSTSTLTLDDTTAKLPIGCGQSTLSGTTDFSGAYPTVATITNVSSPDCVDPNSNVWSVDQVSGSTWNINGDTASLDGVMTGDIGGPGGDIEAHVTGKAFGESCSFQVSGTVPEGGLTFTNPRTLLISTAKLTVSDVTGTGCSANGVGVKDNDAATLSATYVISSPGGGISIKPGP